MSIWLDLINVYMSCHVGRYSNELVYIGHGHIVETFHFPILTSGKSSVSYLLPYLILPDFAFPFRFSLLPSPFPSSIRSFGFHPVLVVGCMSSGVKDDRLAKADAYCISRRPMNGRAKSSVVGLLDAAIRPRYLGTLLFRFSLHPTLPKMKVH